MTYPLWIRDEDKWTELQLFEQLEHLRKHYCTGPCGQSSNVLKTRQITNDLLKTVSGILKQVHTVALQKFPLRNLKLITDPTDPRLRATNKPVEALDIYTLEEMFFIQLFSNGSGLAAPQVGINERFFTTHWGEVFVNPEIEQRFGPEQPSVEGCLSIPGKQFVVQRYPTIALRDGRLYRDAKAIVIQHELDHLNGILISDHGTEVKEE
jgi:peptide deformylase